MGSLFSRPKPPPPPSPAVEATLSAREKQVEADKRQEAKIGQSRRKA